MNLVYNHSFLSSSGESIFPSPWQGRVSREGPVLGEMLWECIYRGLGCPGDSTLLRGPVPAESQPLLKAPPTGHTGVTFHGWRVRLSAITGCWLQTRHTIGGSRGSRGQDQVHDVLWKSHSVRDKKLQKGTYSPRCGTASFEIIKSNKSICTILDRKAEIETKTQRTNVWASKGERQGGMK